jgi:thiol-disulfide isomerase/thioredoxin
MNHKIKKYGPYAGVLFLIVLLISLFLWCRNSENYDNTQSSSKDNNNQSVLLLLYADWCGHCKNVKPLWPQLKEKLPIRVEMIESKDPNMSKYNVKGYPTIRFYKNGLEGEYVEFNGTRDLNTILNFAKSNMN